MNLNLGNIDASRTDLESAYTIAVALNDAETADRMQGLIAELNKPAEPVETEMVETEMDVQNQ